MDAPSPDRRSLLFYATGATGAFVLGAGTWSLLRATGTTADVENAEPVRLYPVSHMEPGTQISVLFEDVPIFIRRRSSDEIAAARAEPLQSFHDPQSRNENRRNADASDLNRTVPPFEGEDRGEWLVVVGVCTRGRCVPLGGGAGDFGGWFCPCCASHYDTSGRIRMGPAPENLHVPRADFADDGLLRISGLRATGAFLLES